MAKRLHEEEVLMEKLNSFLNPKWEEVPGDASATIADIKKATKELMELLSNDEVRDMMETAISIEAYESAQKFKNELDRRKND